MISTAKLVLGLTALLVVAAMTQGAAADSKLAPIKVRASGASLYVDGTVDQCDAVAASLNEVNYGTSAINGIKCRSAPNYLYVDGTEDQCDAVAAALNEVNYGTSAINGIKCSSGSWLITDEPKDAEVLNYILYENSKAGNQDGMATSTDLADLKSSMATDLADLKSSTATSTDLADLKSSTATDLADLKASVDALAPLLTECNARRLARAANSGNSGDSGDSKAKTNAAVIAVPVVVVLMIAAVVATVVVMRARGGNNPAHLEMPATQPNPAFNPPNEAAAAPAPSSNEDVEA